MIARLLIAYSATVALFALMWAAAHWRKKSQPSPYQDVDIYNDTNME